MTEIGRDPFGHPVYLNNTLLKATKVLIIGSVEPHYFAGYTGGRKSIFPGLTDLATIERNHNLANSLEAQPLRLKGNPVAENLDALLHLFNLEKLFTIQLVTDQSGEIADAFCGPLEEAFNQAAPVARKVYTDQFSEPYDIVLAEVRSPLDRNLYQIQKSLENCQTAVKDGGSLVMVSACADGVGSEHFYRQAAEWNRETNMPSDGVMRFGSHKLSRVNLIGRRIKLGVFSKLEEDQVRKVFFEPIHDLNQYIADIETKGARRMAVVHDAGHTVLQQTN